MIATGLQLDIGAGSGSDVEDRRVLGLPARPEGSWTTVDAFTDADIRAEMWAIPLEDGSVDAIWSSHALEHVERSRVAPTLAEWFRVLRPGGTAIIQVPNLDYAAGYWLDHPGTPWALAILFGNQAHGGEFHRTGWNRETLRDDLAAAGFRVDRLEITWDYEQQTIRAEITKP